jgi:hypothetical protein
MAHRHAARHDLALSEPEVPANEGLVTHEGDLRTGVEPCVPATLAREFASGHAVLVRELPYRAQGAVLRAVWHRRNEHDPACAWLPDDVRKAALS